MSKNLYIGVDGVARKVKKVYIGVNGVARRVTAGYRGVGGLARQFFKEPLTIKVGSNTYTSGMFILTSGAALTVTGSGAISASLIGGGGGGGYFNNFGGWSGEGGGAGSLVQQNLTLEDGTYTIAIGTRGSAATSSANATAGGSTSISRGGTALATAAGGAAGQNARMDGGYTWAGGAAPYPSLGNYGAGGDGGRVPSGISVNPDHGTAGAAVIVFL